MIYCWSSKSIDCPSTSLINSLNKAANFIELELSKRIDIRKMPQISFHYDNSYEYGQNIDKLIEELHKEEE